MENTEEINLEGLEELEGYFGEKLLRDNKKIKKDRAIAIKESTERLYKREVEDISDLIRDSKRERNNMLDLSPTDSNSLVLASDFDAKEFVKKDLELGLKIRNLEIKLEIAKSRYDFLFKPKSKA